MEFINTDDLGPYDETIIMDGAEAITRAQCIQVKYDQICKIHSYEKLLNTNSAERDLITGAIDSHQIISLLEDVIGYEEHSPIDMIKFLRDSV